MLNEEMELIGKAEVNSLLLGAMYREGVDALASAILNDQRLQVMLMKAAVIPSLAERAKTFVEAVKERSEQTKRGATKLSLIAKILQRQIGGKASQSSSSTSGLLLIILTRSLSVIDLILTVLVPMNKLLSS